MKRHSDDNGSMTTDKADFRPYQRLFLEMVDCNPQNGEYGLRTAYFASYGIRLDFLASIPTGTPSPEVIFIPK